MKLNECYELGYVAKTHALKGEIQIVLDVDDPEEYEELDSFFILIKGQLVPHFIEKYNLQGNKAIVKLEDIHTIDAAKNLISCKLYLPLDNLPELDEDQFYYHEIIGYQIVDDQLGELGTIAAVYEMPGHDLLGMQYQGKEVLIPMTDAIVGNVDHEEEILHVNLPEGLLDVYLYETSDEEERDGQEDEEEE